MFITLEELKTCRQHVHLVKKQSVHLLISTRGSQCLDCWSSVVFWGRMAEEGLSRGKGPIFSFPTPQNYVHCAHQQIE